jgi:hypothetical protein
LGTQDTGQRQYRDTGNIGNTRHRTKTIQRHWQNWEHKTLDKDNTETLATLGTQDTGQRQYRDTGKIGNTRHKIKTNKNITQKTKKMSKTNLTKNRG